MKFRKLLSATLAFMLAVSAAPTVLGAEDTIDDEIYEAELAEEAENIKKSKGEISEEEKNAIIAEYLAKQQEQAKQDEAPKQETKNNGAKANTSKKNNKKKK